MGRQRLRSSVIWMGLNFFFGFAANAAAEITAAEDAVRIGNAAHLGGLLGGALLTWFIGPRFSVTRKPNPKEGEVPLHIVETNPLMGRVREILFYCIGLAGLLVAAILLVT